MTTVLVTGAAGYIASYILPAFRGRFVRSIEAPSIQNEYGGPFQVFYGISDNTRKPWSIANARKVIGYAPQGDSEIVYADEIRRSLIEPARATMVNGDSRGGKGHH